MSEPNQLATADDHQEPLVQEEKKNVRRRGRRGGVKRLKVTKKKYETAQMLMEMGDQEAYNTIKTMDMNRAKILQNQKIQLELEQKFQEVVAKHKQLTQNNSSVLPVETILPVVSKAEAKKIRQTQQRREPYYSIQQRTVTEEILHVISTIPTLLQTQKPLPSTITPEQSMLQQPELNAATMAPGQSTSSSGQNSWQQQRPFPATTSKQSVLQNAKTGELKNTLHSVFWDTPAKVTRRNKKGKKNKMALLQTPQRAYTVNAGPSQFQAPHQNEPEDLTDDLAPNMAGQSAQPQASPQQRPVTTENKLNFKFQRTVPKNPDWSEYQDKFKRIGGGSPDGEPGETDKEVKQEPNTDQSMNTGFICEEDVEMKEVNAIDTSDLKVAIVTDPYNYLSVEQVKKINEELANRIQDAIFNPNQQLYIPAFEGIPVHNLGYLPLKCQGPKDLFWLHETLSTIPTPIPFTKLTIIPQTNIPDMVKIKMFIPNFSGNLADLQYLLQKQNSWYDMSSWILINHEKNGDDPANYSLQYCVPQMQALIIDNRDRRMAYSLGNVFINDVTLNINEKVFNYRHTASHLQVCVLTTPFHYLTTLEAELIKLALIYKIEKAVFDSEEDEYIPAFRGSPSHFKGGLKLWCESDRDLMWLKDAVATLESPAVGTTLMVSEQTVVPLRVRISMTVPSTEDEAIIVRILKCQNAWCDMESWVLFSTAADPTHGLVLIFYVPPKDVILIRQKNCRLSFLLGYVDIHITSSE